ncbi:MAG: hypothetical protein A2293_04500 [Elusimicrobia bacterium RIFOXYB2_FULL_49_7]|nr:MAG: hypothetical protein A2293_04500 [Elusimicrobia bacterium RIFOXYB2_FULL_49_7]
MGDIPFEYARDASGLDFAAVTDHVDSIGPDGYRILKDWHACTHADGRFVAIPADERSPVSLGGHHNLYFADWETFERHFSPCGTLDKSAVAAQSRDLQLLDPQYAMLIPHHTGINFRSLPKPPYKGCVVDWNDWNDPGLRPVMEIYSHHGQSELYAPDHPLAYEAPHGEGLDADFVFEETVTDAAVYYVRVMQEPIEWPDMAWSSPIWVDV